MKEGAKTPCQSEKDQKNGNILELDGQDAPKSIVKNSELIRGVEAAP